ncbi:universal stress protein [Tropicimonas sp. S265A]|uniref:universal stress protein n=1 Tax=Tropicimonas sp. S265A TaxID=3415134 RepID=UPI003C79AF48
MRSILIATDTHADSDRALARAIRIATAQGAALTVLSVMEDTEQDAALTLRKGLVRDQLALHVGADALDTHITVKAGDPASEIAHASAGCAADLVVMGRHHHRRLLDAVRATTVEKILQSLTCPALLAVSPAAQDYARVLAPVDFSRACKASIEAARALAPQAEIDVIHAVQVPYQTAIAAPGAVGDISHMVDPTPFLEDAEARAKAFSPDQAVTCKAGAISSVFEAAFQEARADLVCLGAHTKTGIMDALLGSFTADMVRNPPTDLLIAPPPRSAM